MNRTESVSHVSNLAARKVRRVTCIRGAYNVEKFSKQRKSGSYAV